MRGEYLIQKKENHKHIGSPPLARGILRELGNRDV